MRRSSPRDLFRNAVCHHPVLHIARHINTQNTSTGNQVSCWKGQYQASHRQQLRQYRASANIRYVSTGHRIAGTLQLRAPTEDLPAPLLHQPQHLGPPHASSVPICSTTRTDCTARGLFARASGNTTIRSVRTAEYRGTT
eukprot:243545-Rhodomonas_salina.1